MTARPRDDNPTKARERMDVVVDELTAGAGAAAVVTAGTLLATGTTPNLAAAIAGGATLLPALIPTLLRAFRPREIAFCDSIDRAAQAVGRTAVEVFEKEELDEDQAAAFYAAYQEMARAIDPRASAALGRLVGEVLFGDAKRDAFFRDAGRLMADGDADEWNGLEKLAHLYSAVLTGLPETSIATHIRLLAVGPGSQGFPTEDLSARPDVLAIAVPSERRTFVTSDLQASPRVPSVKGLWDAHRLLERFGLISPIEPGGKIAASAPTGRDLRIDYARRLARLVRAPSPE